MSETIGARVSTELRERVDDYADAHDLSRSEAIGVLVRRGLGDDARPEGASRRKLERVRERLDDVDEIERRLGRVERRLRRRRRHPLRRLLERLQV